MKKLYAMLILLSIFHCAFNPDEPVGLKDNEKYKLQLYPAGVFPNGGTGLPANYITELSVYGSSMWISTFGGGAARMDTVENLTLYSGTTSAYGVSIVAGSQGAVYLANNGGNYVQDFISTSGTVTTNSGGIGNLSNPYLHGVFNGSNFYVLNDGRNNRYLEANSTDVTTIYIEGNGGNAASTSNLIRRTYSNGDYCMLAEALTDIAADRENDLIAIGYFWTDGTKSPTSCLAPTPPCNPPTDTSTCYEPAAQYMAIYRISASDLTQNKNKGTEIKPIQVGFSGEIPTAIYYDDRSVGSFIDEFVYVASSSALYEVELRNWNSIFDVKRFTKSDGLPSTNIRAILTTVGPDLRGTEPIRRIWAATDRGLAVFIDTWETLDINNSDMPSNNVTDLAYFAGNIWAATDAGLVKVIPQQQEQ